VDIGQELREAREKAGLSIADLTQLTKIQPHKLEALEDNAFDRLPQGVYLDGIVRAYAAEVGLDADVLLPQVREEALLAAAARVASYNDELEHFPTEDAPAEDQSNTTPVMFANDGDTGDHIPYSNASIASHAPMAHVMAAHTAPPARRWIGLAILLLVGMVAVGWGAYLFETSRRSQARAASNHLPASSDRVESLPADAQEPTTDRTAGAGTAARPLPEAAAAVENPRIESPTSAEDARRANTSSPVVAGEWSLATQVESSSVPRFSGLRLGYEIELQQNGNRVSGMGRKVSENGTALTSQRQTPITVEGTIEDNRLRLDFVERGTRRASSGRFDLQFDPGGGLRGRFRSDAARSVGIVQARRLP
jgi:hypothetical protein